MNLFGMTAVLFVATLTLFSPAFAWNATGHKVIAEIAYQNLTPTARKEVDRMVVTFSREYPKIRTFSQMAPWADQLRSQKIEYFTHWHYIDVPFSTDGAALKNNIDTDNATWALQRLEPVLKNPYANPFERARALAFIVHITGDLHQPLHTVSRFSVKYPDGDRGGNLFSLTPYENSKNNLHHLWDTGLGLFSTPGTDENVRQMAADIMRHYSLSYFGVLVDEQDVQQWVAEGVKTARTQIYQTPENTRPDDRYLSKGQQVAEMKAALAGYRLAGFLNHLFND